MPGAQGISTRLTHSWGRRLRSQEEEVTARRCGDRHWLCITNPERTKATVEWQLAKEALPHCHL